MRTPTAFRTGAAAGSVAFFDVTTLPMDPIDPQTASRLPASWRAPSLKSGFGIALMVLGGVGAVLFVSLGVFLDHTPRTEDVPTYGTWGSIVVLLLGVMLFASVPRMRIDPIRGEVLRGDRVVADLTRCRALLLHEVEQKIVTQSGGTMRTRSWTAAVVLDMPAAVAEADHRAARADPASFDPGAIDDGDVVELIRGVPRPRAERIAASLAVALDRPLVIVTADGEVDVTARPEA